MFKEVKILIENIKKFRNLLTEGVDQNDIVDYINNHEYIYIYYAGDETNKRGYRTIRPYVLGTSKVNGNLLLRAWQDRGKSETFGNRPTRPDSEEHDYWMTENGQVPGWRMFRVDKIEKVYPTGKRFVKTDGTVMIPPKYKEGSDKNMASIIAYVSSKKEPVEPEGVPTTTGVTKVSKWANFTHGNKNNRTITARDVTNLSNIASRVYKKSKGSFLVAINNNNDFEIIDVRDKDKVPKEAIVGSLPHLLDTLVKKEAPDKFFNDTKNKLQGELKESKIPTIPFERKTFFKQ
jgi:hypothetical protein